MGEAEGQKVSLSKLYPLEHRVWCGIKQRCNNKKAASYPNYGGRGIRCAKRWQSFENFLKDMGPRPSPAHSIDRIDNNGNYSKRNCRWATRKEQMLNRYCTLVVTYEGQTKTLEEWAAVTGISHKLIKDRLERGWSIRETLTLPKGTHSKDRKGHLGNDRIERLDHRRWTRAERKKEAAYWAKRGYSKHWIQKYFVKRLPLNKRRNEQR